MYGRSRGGIRFTVLTWTPRWRETSLTLRSSISSIIELIFVLPSPGPLSQLLDQLLSVLEQCLGIALERRCLLLQGLRLVLLVLPRRAKLLDPVDKGLQPWGRVLSEWLGLPVGVPWMCDQRGITHGRGTRGQGKGRQPRAGACPSRSGGTCRRCRGRARGRDPRP